MRAVRWSLLLYRALLRLYPLAFRQRFGAEMVQVFADWCANAVAERGLIALAPLWWHTLTDLIRSRWLIHLDNRQIYETKEIAPMTNTAFDQQLVSTFELMARLLRAGYSLRQALEIIALRAPEPTASHFRRLLGEVQNGAALPLALAQWQTQIASAHLGTLLAAIQRQFEEGGNLADRLDAELARALPLLGNDGWSRTVDPQN